MIREPILNYVQAQILPQYHGFDRAHDARHVQKVLQNAMEIAKGRDVDLEMVYVIAAYHDIGIQYGRQDHEKTSARELLGDDMLRQWFTQEQLTVMAEAVEDHRASGKHPPRSLYGCIVAEADRDISYETILRRTLWYGLDNYPDYTLEEHFERTYEHMTAKYGENGYLKLWLDTQHNRNALAHLRAKMADKQRMEADFMALCRKEANHDA